MDDKHDMSDERLCGGRERERRFARRLDSARHHRRHVRRFWLCQTRIVDWLLLELAAASSGANRIARCQLSGTFYYQ